MHLLARASRVTAAVAVGVGLAALAACTSDPAAAPPRNQPSSIRTGSDGAATAVPDAAFMDTCELRGTPGDDGECARLTRVVDRLAARPLRLRELAGDDAGCPASHGVSVDTSQFGLIALGRGPVRPGMTVRSARQGRVHLSHGPGSWLHVKTLWFAKPSYGGPFLVRGERLDAPGRMRFGEGPAAAMIAVRSATLNGIDGYRQVPGGTFVREPGCYGWQVDGVGFSHRIVVEAIGP